MFIAWHLSSAPTFEEFRKLSKFDRRCLLEALDHTIDKYNASGDMGGLKDK